MVRGPNGRRHRYVPRKRRRRRGMERGARLPLLAMALSPLWHRKYKPRIRIRRPDSRFIMEWRMERQGPFLKSVLQEANQHKRQELLRMANADQINAISELVMNTLRGTVPRSRHTITLLKPHAQSLRAVAKPAHSVKRRRAIMMAQKGGALWPELYRCYKRCMR